jgi:hypothetical protein
MNVQRKRPSFETPRKGAAPRMTERLFGGLFRKPTAAGIAADGR